MRLSLRYGLGVSLASLLLVGCSMRLNLAERRAYYDSYVDLAARDIAVARQDNGLLGDLLDHCDAPDQAPYPLLQADADAMQRDADALAARRAQVLAFERDYDAFTQDQGSVGPKDPAWSQYSRLDGRFQPLGASIRQTAQALNLANLRFQGRLQDWGIARVDAVDLRAEIRDFIQSSDGPMGDDDRLFLRQEVGAAWSLRDSLPSQGPVYFGPGTPGGQALLDLKQAEAELARRRHEWDERLRAHEAAEQAQAQPGPAAYDNNGVWQGPNPSLGGGVGYQGGVAAVSGGYVGPAQAPGAVYRPVAGASGPVQVQVNVNTSVNNTTNVTDAAPAPAPQAVNPGPGPGAAASPPPGPGNGPGLRYGQGWPGKRVGGSAVAEPSAPPGPGKAGPAGRQPPHPGPQAKGKVPPHGNVKKPVPKPKAKPKHGKGRDRKDGRRQHDGKGPDGRDGGGDGGD